MKKSQSISIHHVSVRHVADIDGREFASSTYRW